MSNQLDISKPGNGLIGHRGVAGHAPENTLASLRLAKEMGLDWVELDVRRTKNGELIIFHDPTLERTTNGTGRVLQHSMDALRNLDAGSWFSNTYSGEKIPTLSEAIDCLIQLGLNANLEVKCPPTTSKKNVYAFAQKLAVVLQSQWPPHLSKPLVSSFNLEFLKRYKELLPSYPVGVLADKLSEDIIELVKNTPNCTLNCWQKNVSPEQVEQLTSQGLPVLVFTVNDKQKGQSYLDSGAFAIFSDHPDLFFDKS